MSLVSKNSTFFLILTTAALSSCAPPYVWGDADRVERQLMQIVPKGSAQSKLTAAAKARGWDINKHNKKVAELGAQTWIDNCLGQGGMLVPAIVERYWTPFQTTVESIWLFDTNERLARVCVRKTTDAL